MRTLLLPGIIALLSSAAAAGQVPVVLQGQVFFNTFTSGPFNQVPFGANTTLAFQCDTPGTVVVPYELANYSIDPETFRLDAGGVVATASAIAGGPTLSIVNDHPIVDELILPPHLLSVPNHIIECTLSDSTGSVFSNVDLDHLTGLYSDSQWNASTWRISGPGGELLITLDLVAIYSDVSTGIGVGFCTSTPNSTGLPAHASASGCPSVAINDITLRTEQLPPNKNIFLFYGPTATQIPFGAGYLCVSGGIYRLPPGTSDSAGVHATQLDLDEPPPGGSGPGEILPGSTWHFQSWYRDVGGTTNTSDALSISFTP